MGECIVSGAIREPGQPVEGRSARPALAPAPIIETAPTGDDPLIEQLRELGVAEPKARELVKERKAATEEQIAAFPYRGQDRAKKRCRLANSADRE